MPVNEALKDRVAGDVDEAFIRRALDEADLNALRMALYQATGDEEFASMRLKSVKVRGGATTLVEVADEERDRLKDKAVEFLTGGVKGFSPTRPDDAELRRMMELLTGETLTDKDFAYRRDIAAFDEFPRSASWTADKPEIPQGFHVAIVGAGLCGIAVAIQLQRLGIPFTVYERRPELGGTWYINKYPDVRVDTTNFVFQYSFEKNYPWTEYFARAEEIKKYMLHVAKKYGVYDKIQFNSDLTKAAFDTETGTWKYTIARKDGSVEDLVSNVIVSASGLFSTPNKPNIPGLDSFEGTVVHTAEWTGDEDIDGKSVAVIGNGSTGVQLLQAIAKRASSVGVYLRTPQWISPRERYGEPISPESRWLLDTMPYYWNWYIYSMLAMGLGTQVLQEPDPEWQKKGGKVNERNDMFRASLTEYIRKQTEGRPDLFEKLVPEHAPMARRLIVDNGWYKALQEDHVSLITEGIEKITPTGILTADGVERPVDVIVTATGYSVTQYLFPAKYHGVDGGTVEEQWEKYGGGPRAYLSLTIPNFPNFFVLYGPNAQTRSGSNISWFENWARYTVQAIATLIESGKKSMEVREDVFWKYNNDLDELSEKLIWVVDDASKARNYYVNEQGRQQVSAPWRVEDYYQYLEKVKPEDYIFS